MTFQQLWGDELDIQLGSADRSQRFTEARRQAAINKAQQWFAEQTHCFQKEATHALVDGTSEYNLEAVITDGDFVRLAEQGPEIYVTSGSVVTHYAGDDFPQTSIAWLDKYRPGWRNDAGTPRRWYLRENGGQVFFGIYPTVTISGSDTWTLRLPYEALPADMAATTDEPFSVAGNPLKHLRTYHDALPLYGAAILELLRKDRVRHLELLQLAQARVEAYEMRSLGPERGESVVLAHNYRSRAHVGTADPWK